MADVFATVNAIMDNFDDIRPYYDDEVVAAIARLISNQDFLDLIGLYHSPKLSRYLPALMRFGIKCLLRQKLGKIGSVKEFQHIVATYANRIVASTMTKFRYEGIDQMQADQTYLFVSNHRDIAGDPMLIDYVLWLSGMDMARLAIGDNLMQREFVTDLMRLNKGFFIKRSEEGVKKVYAALMLCSRYIHDSIASGESIWIAQSEGRSKDGIDVTDPAIIKMFALAKRKRPLYETVRALNIVPVSISYEYDPCDYIKAKELSLIRTSGGYEKLAGEDLSSLAKGLGGFKGRVYLRVGKPLTDAYQNVEEVAHAIDRQILNNYQLYHINYWALSILAADPHSAEKYASTWASLGGTINLPDTAPFASRLAECPEAHRTVWLEMYANPVVNKYTSKSIRLAPL